MRIDVSTYRPIDLPSHRRLQNEPNIGGALSEPAGEIGIPAVAKRHVDSHVEAVRYKRFLQISSNSVQHLVFEPRSVDSLLSNESIEFGDDCAILRCDRGVERRFKQSFGLPYV